MSTIYVTTSWDDGHTCDLRLAALLKQYHIKATFYIAPYNHEQKQADLLTADQVRTLAADFEIGAHTLTHPYLTQVSDDQAQQEITGSKKYLETLLRQPVTAFCYPGGFYQAQHKAYVRQAGFALARSVERFQFATGGDPFAVPTSVHAYRHWSDAWRIARFCRFNPVRYIRYQLNWDALAIAMYQRLQATGGVFHLWGHSWEIDNHRDWQRLEAVLAFVSQQPEACFVTNSELMGHEN